jgi:hypothetical protein
MPDDIRPPKVPADFFALVERNLGSAKNKEPVSFPAGWIRTLLLLAKRAPQARSRPPLTMVQKRRRTFVLLKARKRKAELMAQGMRAEPATEQAAREAQARLGRNLSVETIKRRMRSRRRIWNWDF